HGRLPRLGRTAAASTERRKPVTVTTERPGTTAAPATVPRHNTGILRWLTSTDHKVIGLSYLVTSFVFFCVARLLALGMRAPLSGATYGPGAGPDLWIVGVTVTSTATVLGAVNMVTTIFMLRAPGMTMFRMPIFTWNMLVTSVMVLLAFPVLTSALAMLFADRHLDAHIFEVQKGGTPVLWQHLFWFFGHPEVYIVALPFFGVVTEILPVFSRRPVFGYQTLI